MPQVADSPQAIPGTREGNHPPRFIRAHPYMDPSEAIRIRPGQRIRIPVLAVDADGDAITYGTKTLPRAAEFDAENQSFSWTPVEADAGLHSVIFTATDGLRGDSLLVQFVVVTKPPAPGESQVPIEEIHRTSSRSSNREWATAFTSLETRTRWAFFTASILN